MEQERAGTSPAERARPPRRPWGVVVAGGAVVAAGAASFAMLFSGLVDSPAPPLSSSTSESPPSAGGSTTPTAGVLGAPPPGVVDSAQERREALTALLGRRADALLEGDADGWAAALDPRAGDFSARQRVLFERLRALPLTSWRYEVGGDLAGLSAQRRAELGGQAWVAEVWLAYRLEGDTREIRRRQVLTVRESGARLVLAGDADVPLAAGTPRDLWDLTDIVTARGERSLVIGATSQEASLARYARVTDAAARRVDGVWGKAWPRTVVVVVPETTEDMAKVLGRAGTGGLDQIAAVTTGEIERIGGGTPSTTADRVVLNPEAFDSFESLARRVVLTHEVFHVATRAGAVSSAPLWLEEGMADYVAYRGTGLTRRQIAGDLLTGVAEGNGPTALPSPQEFDPTAGVVDQAYAGAWLAVDMLDEEGGLPLVMAFYRAAVGLAADGTPAAPTPEDPMAAAYAVVGTDAAGFTQRWLAYLEAKAG